MSTNEEKTFQKVNPWLARVALLLMPAQILMAAALVVGVTLTEEDQHIRVFVHEPLFGYARAAGGLVLVLPFIAILLSIVNWFLKTWKKQRTWKDTGLVVLTLCYTFILGPVVQFFVVLCAWGPI